VTIRPAIDRFLPWSGLAVGTLGYFVAHQLGSDATFQDCAVGSPLVVIIATIVGLAIIGLGALGSWRIFAASGESPARKLVASLSLMASLLFAIALILPFVAALIIPRCGA